MQVVIHHREATLRPLAAKHKISNPKSEADVESSRDATFLSVVGVDGNRDNVCKFLRAMLDLFFAIESVLRRAGTRAGHSE